MHKQITHTSHTLSHFPWTLYSPTCESTHAHALVQSTHSHLHACLLSRVRARGLQVYWSEPEVYGFSVCMHTDRNLNQEKGVSGGRDHFGAQNAYQSTSSLHSTSHTHACEHAFVVNMWACLALVGSRSVYNTSPCIGAWWAHKIFQHLAALPPNPTPPVPHPTAHLRSPGHPSIQYPAKPVTWFYSSYLCNTQDSQKHTCAQKSIHRHTQIHTSRGACTYKPQNHSRKRKQKHSLGTCVHL